MAPMKNYTPDQMGRALEAVRKGQSVSSAAKKYGVPRITLHNKSTGKSPAVCSMGPSSVLSKDEESILVEWLFAMSSRHCPVAKEQLLDSVQAIVKSNNKETPFTDGRPGRKWYQAFLTRHPEVSERLAQNLTTSREAVNENQITSWFSEVNDYLVENGLGEVMKDPTRVFNTDESAFFLNPNPGHVLVRKGDKNVYSVSGNEKENLTVLITANAAGQIAPPMVVFAYERIPKHVADGIPESWAIGKSESGWMCSSTFYEYVTNVFYPWIIENKIKLPVVFFLDGHASHVTKHLSDFCSDKQIEIIALYPNSTHILQPMDIAVFRPLKLFWRKHVRKWKTENLGQQVKKDKFAMILKCALDELSPDTIKNGFRAGGLFPFGPEYVDFSKMHTHNRRLTAADKDLTKQDSDFFSKLEQEIVNAFTQSKLDLYERCFFTSRTDLNDILPPEDLTMYVIWAKYKHLCHANRNENYEHKNQEAASVQEQNKRPDYDNRPVETLETYKMHQKNTVIVTNTSLEDVPSTSAAMLMDKESDAFKVLSHTENKPAVNTDTIDTHKNQELINLTHNTPNKNPPSSSFAELMLKEKNITVPSPFKKALFWPEPTIKKKGRMPKVKLPSAITSKAWKEFHQKKELDKKIKEEEKEKRKQERIDKKAEKDEQMKNKKRNENNSKCKKRRKLSVTSSDAEESDVTYAESGESDIEIENVSENDSITKENTNIQTYFAEEIVETTENKPIEDDDKENNEINKSAAVEEQIVLEKNVSPVHTIKLLDNVEVQMILDHKTGTFKFCKKRKLDGPKVGKHVLVKFHGKNMKKTYRYVCTIQEVSEERLVVQGLRSCKSKEKFKIIENDVSIIEESDILTYLPSPVKQNNYFIFPHAIDIKEAI